MPDTVRQRAGPPPDPRLEPFVRLRRLMPLAGDAADRRLLHRIDLREAVAGRGHHSEERNPE